MSRVSSSIQELVAEVDRQRNSRRDFVVPAARLLMNETAELAIPTPGSTSVLPVNTIGHDQLSQYVGIPRDFYGRLLAGHPDLLSKNVNRFLAEHNGEKRLVRTLDTNVRAFLSDRYRPMDNAELLESLLPVLFENKSLRYRDAAITERRLYLKIISDELVGEVKPGDEVRMGLIIQNSEVGMGALTVAPFSDRLVCSNGMVHTNLGQRRAHLGGRLEEGEFDFTYSDETHAADQKAFQLKLRDTVKGVLTGGVLQKLLVDMRTAASDKIEGDIAEVVEVTGKNFGFTEPERASVLRNLIEGADTSRWGLANAITATAKGIEDYDRSTEFQQIGGRLVSEPLKLKKVA